MTINLLCLLAIPMCLLPIPVNPVEHKTRRQTEFASGAFGSR